MTTLQSYQLDLSRYELRRSDGVRIKLERQPMELLILLVEKRNQLVTREQVAARLWPDGITVDTVPAINNAVSKIRAALRDSPENPKHLETVVGKGYRFIGSVEVIPAEAPVPGPDPLPPVQPRRPKRLLLFGAAIGGLILAGAGVWALLAWRASAGPIRSVAVLPLQNLSGDPAQNYFADGLTDELITDLARIGSLRVVSRTSILQYAENRKSVRQIAGELNVEAVIEGSVVRSGSRVRITAQLIDARRDAHLWARSYEGELSGILDLQDSVALDIASQVKVKLSAEEHGSFARHPAVNAEAYDAYLRGRNEIGKQSTGFLHNAVQDFQKAIDLDPFYPAAYAGLADSLSLMANYGLRPPKEVFPRAEAAARKALELDAGSAEAHASLAVVRHHFDWDWSGAEAEYRRALQLSPRLALAHLRYSEYLSSAGRHEESLREINLARESDPLSLTIRLNVGAEYYYARRYDDAIRECRSVTALHPDRAWAWVFLGMALEQKKLYAEAIAAHERALQLTGWSCSVGLGHVYAAAGRTVDARRIASVCEKPDESGQLDWAFIGAIYAALGDKEQAFAWLDKAYDNRDFFLTSLMMLPWFDPLRGDPRFARLMEKVGIPNGRGGP